MIGRIDRADQAKCNEQGAGALLLCCPPGRDAGWNLHLLLAGWMAGWPELSAKLPTYLPGRSAISLGTAHIRNGFEFSRLVFDSY